MIGSIAGDIIGSVYEYDNIKTKDFRLFGRYSDITDDTIMTVAVERVMLDEAKKKIKTPPVLLKRKLVKSMTELGRKYPNYGYGEQFSRWLKSKHPKPYNSYGNGSAMRVSSVGMLFDSLDDVLKYAKMSAEVSHNHPEGIKGAQAVAAAVYMAHNGATKKEIWEDLEALSHYDLNHSCEEIRNYKMDGTCQKSVPEAITAFLEGESFEDVIRTAVSIGGDSDTIACIAGGIAEAYYGKVPEEIQRHVQNKLLPDLLVVVNEFYDFIDHKNKKEIGAYHPD